MAGTTTSFSTPPAAAGWLSMRLGQIRRKARRLLWTHGVCRLIVVLLGSLLVVGSLDWLVHIDDAGVRMVLGLAILAAAAWIVWRFLARPLSRSLSNVEIALEIERRYPGFRDGLASSVQFLEERTNPRLGSPDLQRRVIEETIQQAGQVDLDDVFETSGVRRSLCAAAAMCLVAAAAFGLFPAQAEHALVRLVNPFAAAPWPRTTELRFIDADLKPLELDPARPLRLARGDRLELYLENEVGPLPDDVSLVYELEDGQQITEGLRPSTVRDSTGLSRDVCVATLAPTGQTMRFRATGGDDRTMPWYRLELVPPPLIESLQVTAVPPAYTHRPPQRLRDNVGHVEGLVGTRVEITARASKPLQSARLHRSEGSGELLPLSQDARQFQAMFLIEQPVRTSYWFDIQDEAGFANTQAPKYEVHGIADAPPQVSLQQPAGDLYVTPEADVTLGVLAKDDVGLVQVRVPFRITGTVDDTVSAFPLPFEPPLSPHASLQHDWRLSELPLVAGMQIVFHAEATDAFDLDSPHIGKSQQRTLTIVTPEEKTGEIASRQAGLLEELEQVTTVQSRAHGQVGELQAQLSTAGRLQGQDIDLLKRIEVDQRHVSGRLGNPVDGIESHVLDMLAEFEQNKLTDAETRRRLRFLADELAALRTDHLPQAEQHLTDTRKIAESMRTGTASPVDPAADDADSRAPGNGPAGDAQPEKNDTSPTESVDTQHPEEPRLHHARSQSPSEALSAGRQHQSAVLDSLNAMVGQLSEWQRQRDSIAGLDEIVRDQKRIQRDAAEIGDRTLSKPLSQLTPQQRADLNRLAVRQRGLAGRFDQFRSTLESASEQPEGRRGQASEIAEEALELSSRQSTAGRMRQTADEFERNQVGQAADGQRQILDDLDELQSVLTGQSETGVGSRLQKLQGAQQQLEQLHKRQEELSRQNASVADDQDKPQPESASQELERLVRQQQQLRDEAAGLARRLQRLRANGASRSSGRGADSMQRAQQHLSRGEHQAAGEDQREALDDLEQAQRELARARRQAEQELAQELVRRLADVLPGLAARQQNVIDETTRLEALRADRGNWSRGQLISLRSLADEQQSLADETNQLAERVEPVPAFALGMRGAAQNMARAGQWLSERKTDPATLQVEQAAHKRLADLIDALQPPSETGEQPPPTPAPPDGNQQPSGPQGDAIGLLAQLKLLKTMQEDLIRRTADLVQVQQNSRPLSTDEQSELESLAREQGELAELAGALVASVTPPDAGSDADVDAGSEDDVDPEDTAGDTFDLPGENSNENKENR